MSIESENQLPPPPFDDTDKAATAPADTLPEPPVADSVGGAVPAQADTALPKPAAESEAKNESTETDEDSVTFDLLVQLDKENLKVLFGKLDMTVAATALASLDAKMQGKVLGALSKEVAEALRAEIVNLGTVSEDAAAEAQDSIVEKAEELEEAGTLSLDALYEEEPVKIKKEAPSPRAGQVELPSSALAGYFKGVKNLAQFREKIAAMQNNKKLRDSLGVEEIEKIAQEVYPKLVGSLDQFEEKARTASPKKLVEFSESFIKDLPSGFQGALRRIIDQEISGRGSKKPARRSVETGSEPSSGFVSNKELEEAGIGGTLTPAGPLTNEQLTELGLEGTGWKEKPSEALVRAQGGVQVSAASELIPSPDSALAAQMLSETEFPVDKALSMPGFLRFKVAREKATGVVIDTAESKKMRACFEAFASRDKVSNQIFELYRDRWADVLGIKLSPEAAAALRISVEKSSIQDPGGFDQTRAIAIGLTEMPREIAGLEREIAAMRETVSADTKRLLEEELDLATFNKDGMREVIKVKAGEEFELRGKLVQEKAHLLEVAAKTNHWLTGGGFVGEGVNRILSRFGSGKAQERAQEKVLARETARRLGTKSTGVEKAFQFGLGGLNNERIAGEIKVVKDDIKKIEGLIPSGAKLAEIRGHLDGIRAKLFHDSDVAIETNKMLQSQLKALYEKGMRSDSTFEEVDDAEAVFGRALRTPLEESVGHVSVLEGMPEVPEMIRKLKTLLDSRLKSGLSEAFEQTIATGDDQSIILNNKLETVVNRFASKRGREGIAARKEIRQKIIVWLDEKYKSLEAMGTEDALIQAAGAKIVRDRQEAALARGV